MAIVPLITTRVTITVKDINNNSVAKTFNSVRSILIDYVDATINIVDQLQGSFYFGISTVTTVTYTVTGTTTTIVMS